MYATVTVAPWAIADANVNTDVEPEFATDDTATAEPSARTVKSPTAGVADANASSNVSVNSVPFAANDGAVPDANAGAVASTVELLLTVCAENDAVRFPTASWNPPDCGLVYATVTVAPWAIADANVNTDVEPEFATDDTVTAEPPANTVNAPAAGSIAAFNCSSNVSVNAVPFAANDGAVPDARAGGVVSEETWIELLVINCDCDSEVDSEKDSSGSLLPFRSCPVFGCVYVNVTAWF